MNDHVTRLTMSGEVSITVEPNGDITIQTDGVKIQWTADFLACVLEVVDEWKRINRKEYPTGQMRISSTEVRL